MGKTTTNYSLKKETLGHPIRDTFTAANLDLIDAAIKARQDSIESLKGVITLDMSFEANLVSATKIYFPFTVEIEKIRSIVTKAVADTDNGTITGANSVGASTNGVVTVAASSAVNDEDTATPTTNVSVAAGSYYKLTTAKETKGGTVLVTLEYKRTA